MKVHSLAELGAIREAMRRAALASAERLARLLAAQKARDALVRRQPTPDGLFARSVGPVHLLRDCGLAVIDLPRPAPHPRQRELDEQAALAESLSDEVNVESLLLTDDGLSFRRPGIGPDVVTKLRRGDWALQGQIDLHGCTRDEAREVLAGYIRDSHRLGKRCLRVVHGKGNGSPGRQPVLKARVQRWLAQCGEVIAFSQASGPQGGAGALMVLLAGSR
jgi:DNA-nicking Smr family endonuclease